jgi:hypothetical protein
MVYIFITHPESPDDDFFDPDIIYPDEGENAIIIQPDGEIFVETRKLQTGPTLYDRCGKPYEGFVRIKYAQDPDFIDSATFSNLSEGDKNRYVTFINGNKIGGTPYFFQGDEWPEGEDWLLLMQLNSNFLPFNLNLGGSPTAFAFISKDFKKGKLLIQDL